MKRAISDIAMAVFIAATCSATAFPQTWVDISDASSYTLTPANPEVMTRMGIWPYFQANHITAGVPFPDNGVLQAYGLDPGNCVTTYLPTGTICRNYRFLCTAVRAAGRSGSAITFNLVDLNALAYNQPDDPAGTCYLSPFMLPDGTAALGLAAIIVSEPRPFHADPVGTMGWFSVLAGGNAATHKNSGYMTLIVTFNPRIGDPQSFTFGDQTTALKNVFTLTGVGNANEPSTVNGVSGGVFARSR